MTRLCVSIFVESVEQAKRDIAAAVEAGADMVELRLDLMPGADDVHRLTRGIAVPFVFTCRPPSEGGQSDAPDAGRLELLREVFSHDHYLDIELSTLRSAPDSAFTSRRSLIVSHHDFTGRPDKLYNLVRELNSGPGTINKIAWMARSIRDNIEAFELLIQRQKPTIALCMGEAGLTSRVLAKKFGAFLSYVSLRPSEVTAPGQPTIGQIKRTYRWDAIDADTRVYGVVGAPIAHSLSPAVHNAAFDHVRENAVYLPMLVQPGYESFKAFMEEFTAFKSLDLRGLSVTIPHKENALRYLREKGARIEPLAEEIGAVNTITVSEPGQLEGFNTDYAAIVETITSSLGVRPQELAERRVAVIGAGGTARTAVAAMAKLGATVVVYNRTKDKAEQLAREFDGKGGKVVAARLQKLCDSCCHIFINTTPLGMHPKIDQSPLGDRFPEFTPETLVFDTIYNPPKTKLLRQAEEAGAQTISGMEMFVRQAVRQFELWTGEAAPIEVMRVAFERGMGVSPIRPSL